MIKFLKEFIRCLIHELKHEFGCPKDDLWFKLCEANEIDLICLLRRAEKHEVGYTTIIIPKNGFVKDKELNNLIIKWLRNKTKLIYNPEQEIQALKNSLQIKSMIGGCHEY